ncbi:hypothetical protein ACIQM4_31640 [Streptomyces sp. NPDC091272]|uniref:hypothetical protein n=1 Tax=Streptomyces sp. NPDC091272 TaxID=3365981 RepID=UPI0037F15932
MPWWERTVTPAAGCAPQTSHPDGHPGGVGAGPPPGYPYGCVGAGAPKCCWGKGTSYGCGQVMAKSPCVDEISTLAGR